MGCKVRLTLVALYMDMGIWVVGRDPACGMILCTWHGSAEDSFILVLAI